MKVGDFEIKTIDSGRFRLDGGAMFGVVPKVLWEKSNPADAQNRIEMALRMLLVRAHGRVILVDTGIGEKWGAKPIDMYQIDHSEHQLDKAMAKAGVTREEVTDVVLTHLHFDHVGGATRFDKAGKIELTFPNAEYLIQEENVAHAHAPSEKDKASFVETTIRPLAETGKLKRLGGGKTLVPGVEILVTHGHTPGHQLLKVTSAGQTFLFCGDTIPTSSHIPAPWVMAYDLHPMTTIQEKKTLLRQAVQDDWVLVFAHDPFMAACKVKSTDGKFSKGEEVFL